MVKKTKEKEAKEKKKPIAKAIQIKDKPKKAVATAKPALTKKKGAPKRALKKEKVLLKEPKIIERLKKPEAIPPKKEEAPKREAEKIKIIEKGKEKPWPAETASIVKEKPREPAKPIVEEKPIPKHVEPAEIEPTELRPKVLEIETPIPLKEFALRIGIKPNELIVNLMTKKILMSLTTSQNMNGKML